jgi:shikimate dehydrogenase
MHNAAFAHLGLNAVYLPFESGSIDEVLEVASAFDVRGLSVTAPLKTGAFARAAAVDDVGRVTGSINTLSRTDAVASAGAPGWQGRNFDVPGFLTPLVAREVPVRGRRAVVLGAGGAARTAAYALKAEGGLVEIAARRPDASAALAKELGVRATSFPPEPGWDLLVNTTPVGTWPETEAAPIPRDAVRGRAVYDLVYNPEDTCLLRWAREDGIDTVGGMEMLVAQAAHQFSWWTGQPAPMDVMAEAARRFVRDAHGRS